MIKTKTIIAIFFCLFVWNNSQKNSEIASQSQANSPEGSESIGILKIEGCSTTPLIWEGFNKVETAAVIKSGTLCWIIRNLFIRGMQTNVIDLTLFASLHILLINLIFTGELRYVHGFLFCTISFTSWCQTLQAQCFVSDIQQTQPPEIIESHRTKRS